MKKWITNVLLIIFSLVFLVSLGFLLDYFMESRKEQNTYDDLSNLVEDIRNEQLATQDTEPGTNGSDSEVVVEPDYQDDEPGKPRPSWVSIRHPVTGELVKVLPEYSKVFPLNSDMVGWIKIEGTRINYPVVQTTDPEQEDFYLDHNFNKEESKFGCIYVDELCDVNKPSDNITLYGHNMRDGSMFAALHSYRNEDFYKEHPTIQFDTLTKRNTYEIISVFTTTASFGKGFVYHAIVDMENEETFLQFVTESKELSLYDTGVDAVYGDKLICLSTCEYTQEEGRLVVVAKRVVPVVVKPGARPGFFSTVLTPRGAYIPDGLLI